MKPTITRERLELVEAAVTLVQTVVGTERAPERVVVHRRELRVGFAGMGPEPIQAPGAEPEPPGSRSMSPMRS